MNTHVQSQNEYLLTSIIKITFNSQAINVSKEATAKWKTLSPSQRIFWDNQAEEEKNRYYKEKAVYEGLWKLENGPNRQKRWKVRCVKNPLIRNKCTNEIVSHTNHPFNVTFTATTGSFSTKAESLFFSDLF